jgi:hypothetical protein
MASTDESQLASLDAPTDPLMGSDSQQLKDESRPGDHLALYTAVVRFYQLPIQTRTPDRSLGLCIGDCP